MTQNPEERIKELEDLLRDGLMYEPGDHPFDWYQNVRRALGEPLAERPGEPEVDAVINAVVRDVAFRSAHDQMVANSQTAPVQTVVTRVKEAQATLAKYVEPGSLKETAGLRELINELLGILDDQDMARAIRDIESR